MTQSVLTLKPKNFKPPDPILRSRTVIDHVTNSFHRASNAKAQTDAGRPHAPQTSIQCAAAKATPHILRHAYIHPILRHAMCDPTLHVQTHAPRLHGATKHLPHSTCSPNTPYGMLCSHIMPWYVLVQSTQPGWRKHQTRL